MEAAKKTEDQKVNKPTPERIQSNGLEQAQAGFESGQLPGHALGRLPSGVGTSNLRRAAVLQLQRSRGNAFVMRQVLPDAQRQDETTRGTTDPTKISGPGSSVSAEGGAVNISAPIMNVNVPFTNVNGVLRATTIMADSVVSASYTPGAGNVW